MRALSLFHLSRSSSYLTMAGSMGKVPAVAAEPWAGDCTRGSRGTDSSCRRLGGHCRAIEVSLDSFRLHGSGKSNEEDNEVVSIDRKLGDISECGCSGDRCGHC